MNSHTDLHDILDKVAAQMTADFQASAIVKHRGSKGAVREETVRSFLADYLPGSATVTGSGELLAATGEVSGQCDVMVLDAGTPPLWKEESYRIAPIECCYATIEVKSDLTRPELKKAWGAAKKMKSLPRSAYLKDPGPIAYTRTAYGRQVDTMPPQVHVFAYSGASLAALGEELASLAEDGDDHSLGIDSVCVLDKGLITWANLRTSGLGMRLSDSKVAAYQATPGQVLLYLATTLNKHLATATMNPKFDIAGYITGSLGDLYGMWPGVPPSVVDAVRQQVQRTVSDRHPE